MSYGIEKTRDILPAHLFAKAFGHLNQSFFYSFLALKVCDTPSFAGHAIAKIPSIDFPYFISHLKGSIVFINIMKYKMRVTVLGFAVVLQKERTACILTISEREIKRVSKRHLR